MGGIVARRLIVQRRELFKSMQIGLFLIASPSLGSEQANVVSGFATILGFGQAQSLKFSQQNTWLNALDSDFKNLKESGEYSLFGKELIEDKALVLPKVLRGSQTVKPFSAARYFGDAYKVPNSDHLSISKVENNEAIQHRLLIQFLKELGGKTSELSEFSSKSNITDVQSDFLYIPKLVDDIFQYNGVKPSLVGRKEELAELNDFTSCDGDFKWWVVLGQGGVGKSKLVFAWIQHLRNQGDIEAGYVKLSDINKKWQIWQPLQSTFIVVDNAAEQIDLVKKIIEGLIHRNLNHNV